MSSFFVQIYMYSFSNEQLFFYKFTCTDLHVQFFECTGLHVQFFECTDLHVQIFFVQIYMYSFSNVQILIDRPVLEPVGGMTVSVTRSVLGFFGRIKIDSEEK